MMVTKMMIRYQIKHFISAWALSGLLLASCSSATEIGTDPSDPNNPNNPSDPSNPANPSVVVAIQAADYDNGGTLLEGENTLTNVRGCLFVDGKMTAVYEPSESKNTGDYTFSIENNEGTFYVLANAGTTPDWNDLLAAGTTEKEFLASTQGLQNGKPISFFSGSKPLDNKKNVTLPLKRGVARFDLLIRSVGNAAVEKLTLNGAMLSTGCFPDSASTMWMEQGSLTFTPSTPYTDDTKGVAYLYEQPTAGATLTAHVVTDGKAYDLEAKLPETIQRNHIYVITVLQGMVESDMQLTVEEWEQGSDTEVVPDFAGDITVNTQTSELPNSVIVSADKKEVTLPASATDMLLALDCNDELEVQPVTDYPITVEPVTATKALTGTNLFRIRKELYAPGVPADQVALRFRRKGLNDVFEEDKIVLHLSANQTSIEGEITFDRDRYRYDFGRYVDNELGRMTLPVGKELIAEAPEGEDPWVKIISDESNPQIARIIGGWHPNDPKADGRTQTARLVIRNTDGTEREEYTISRQNWGLPVVKFGNNWWCKYNLRGDATSFTDQISIKNDLADDAALADYLTNCDASILLDAMGDCYQGGNVQGLPLKHNGTGFYFEGMKASAQDFGGVNPTSMAPAGYQIPAKADLAVFGANEDYNLGGIDNTPRTFVNTIGKTVKIRVIELDATFLNQHYGNVSLYEFTSDEGTFVLCGLGHQWDTTVGNISVKSLIVATYGQTGKSWTMEGYANSVKKNQNWWKYTTHNSTKTRIIRCIKTPVEYIY